MVTADWRNLPKRRLVERHCDSCEKVTTVTVESLRKYPQSENICRTCVKKENGYEHSEETCLKISNSKLGKKVKPRSREFIENNLVGKNNPFFGRTHSEESKKKITETRSKNPNFLTNLREGLKKRDLSGKNNGMFGKPPRKPKRSKLKYKNYTFRSSWELNFAKFLDQENFNWEYEPTTILLEDGSGYTPDFIINGDIYEIKGYYWNDDDKFLKAKNLYQNYNFYLLDQKALKSMGVL